MLRALVGLMLMAQGLAYFREWGNPGPMTLAVGALALTSGLCLVSGFLTPITGFLVVLGSVVFGFSSFSAPGLDVPETKLVIVNVIVISMAIGLLGPGAFSLDAVMFGRREISIPITSRPRPLERLSGSVSHHYDQGYALIQVTDSRRRLSYVPRSRYDQTRPQW